MSLQKNVVSKKKMFPIKEGANRCEARRRNNCQQISSLRDISRVVSLKCAIYRYYDTNIKREFVGDFFGVNYRRDSTTHGQQDLGNYVKKILPINLSVDFIMTSRYCQFFLSFLGQAVIWYDAELFFKKLANVSFVEALSFIIASVSSGCEFCS